LFATASYVKPKTIDEALTILAAGESRILSGGTDFYPALGDRLARGPVLDVSGLKDLRGIAKEKDHYRMGGLTTWTDVIKTPLPRSFNALKAAAREVGSAQIQNRGTVAGNLCNASPAADGVPPLLALEAEVELISQSQTRRLPLGDFIVGNRKTKLQKNEILSAVLIPRDMEDDLSVFLKLGARRYLVISISMVAVMLQCTGGQVQKARIAVGSCSAVAQRLRQLESDLVGASIQQACTKLKPEHLTPLSPIDDLRATATYRRDASFRLVQRAIDACVGVS
jgi:CO/xanthine dehydrogenase FAD-binding subunit